MDKLIVKEVQELKTSKGDPYKKVDLQKTDGTVVAGVSAFKFKFPNLESLVIGAEIEGSIVIDGNYKNLVGVVEKPKGNPGFKAQQIEKTMERKEQSISRFQDTKELSIKTSSTMRDAVLLAIAEYRDSTVLDKLDEAVLKWREWLWKHWDDPEQYPPF